ncbi:MAG: hypothetical protein ABSE99_10530 [Terracidiphilus sp.]
MGPAGVGWGLAPEGVMVVVVMRRPEEPHPGRNEEAARAAAP